jgi:hypothetical protein
MEIIYVNWEELPDSSKARQSSEKLSMWSVGLAANFAIQLRGNTGFPRKIKRKLILSADFEGRINHLQQKDGIPNDVRRVSKRLNLSRGIKSDFLKSFP